MRKENIDPSIFKEFLKPSKLYVGGKSKSEIQTSADKIYKLSSNENLLGPSPLAMEAVKKTVAYLHEYPERTDLKLRKALEGFYNGKLTADQFITGPSGSEVLDYIIRAFMEPGLEFIVSNPCFKPYEMFCHKMGGVLVDVPLLDPDYRLDVKGILNAINDKIRFIFLTSPNNPTGTYIPKEDLDQLIPEIPPHVIVVLDEVYYHYADAGNFVTAQHYVDQGYNVVGLNSLSKTFGLAGLRVGYAYSTLTIADYVRRMYKPFQINTPGLEGGIAALKDEVFLNETVGLVRQEKEKIYRKLESIGVNYWKSQANFYMIRPEMGEENFEQEMVRLGIMVRPVTGFGAPGCIRITIGTVEANDACLKAIEKVYDTYRSRQS